MLQYLKSIALLWTIWVIGPVGINAQSAPIPLSNPSNCGLWLNITDEGCSNPQQFDISVNTAPGTSLGTDVYLEKIKFILGHEWLADVEMRLISPSGIEVDLIDEVGSGNRNFGDPLVPNCTAVTSLVAHTFDQNCGFEKITASEWPYLDEYLPIGNFSSFNDGSSPIGTWRLEICDDAKPDTGSLHFVELIFSSVNCIQPSDVQVIGVDSNSVQLNWVPGSLNCSNTILEYGPPGFQPGTGVLPGAGTVQQVGCPPLTLTGLDASTSYEIYIRQNCGGGNVSVNACPVEFSTACSPAPATLTETFDSQELCLPFCGVICKMTGIWSNSLIDDTGFDWIVNEDSTGTAGTGPKDDFPGGGKYVYIDYSPSGCRSGNFAALTSTCIDVLARTDTCDMSFDYYMHGVHVQSLALEATIDGGETWIELWSLSGNQKDQWVRVYVDLSLLNGQTAQFRFLGEGGSQKKGDIALDNIIFYGSTVSSSPVFTYYADQDGDGYGGRAIYYQSCQPFNLPGFVPDSTDCNDDLLFINPGMSETPCDMIDLNCNPFDEFELPPPTVQHDTVCSGDIGFLESSPSQFGGEIHWFASESDTLALAIGNSFSPIDFPVNLSTSPIELTYYAEEINGDSCRSTARTEGHIVILPQPEISTTDNPFVCYGAPYDLTTIDVIDATGANGVITYHDGFPATPSNEIDPMVFPTGVESYYVASTPSGGCTDVVEVDFQILPSPIAEINGDDFICFESNSAQLIANDFGSVVPPVELIWNTGETSPSISIFPNIQKGATDIYILTISYGNGCFDSDTLEVLTTTSVDNISIDKIPVSDCQGNDGSITLNPNVGQAPFDYFWSGNGQSGSEIGLPGSFTLNGLSQGAYAFTVTDASAEACSSTLPIVAVDGPGAILTSSQISPVTCNGGADGCIEINVVGNNPEILWDNGATTEEVCGLAAGTHSVTITDGICQTELTYVVPEPDKLVVSSSLTDVSCHGGNDGKIILSTFNGNGGYQYEWGHGPTLPALNNLSQGSYAVTITDSKGCFIEIPFLTIDEPDPLAYDMDLLGEPSCFGGEDGYLTISPTGGTAPYDVDWNNAGMGTTINSLSSGTYEVSIEDANGCEYTDEIFLSQPLPLSVLLDNMEAPACNGIDDGTLEVTVNGGSGNYTYLWSNGMVEEDLIQTLSPGAFTLTVTDGLGCTGVSEPYVLIENPFIELQLDLVHPTCFGSDDGSIAANVISGGVGPFSFNWSIDESGQSIHNLAPSDYTVTVIDDLGCQFDSTVSLITNQVLDVDWIATDPACFGTSTGQIEMNIAGGSQPYFINWSTSESTNPIDSLIAGNYAATVTDNNGCKYFTPFISLKDAPLLTVDAVSVESVTCFGDNDGNIELNVSGGTPPLDILWSNGGTSSSLSGLAPGIYSVTVTDDNGCVDDHLAMEINSPELLVSEATSSNLGCVSFSTDTICLNVEGGVTPYEFLWNNGFTEGCLYNSPVGDYSVTITDASGCTHEMMSVKVTEDIDVIGLSVQNAGLDSICAGDANGSLQVVITGGNAPYQFIWSNGVFGSTLDTVFALNSLSGGSYQITITDDLGCTKNSEVLSVIEADSIEIIAPGYEQTPVNCFEGSDGAIDISVIGGFSNYQFYWENTSGEFIGSTEDLENLSAGEYFLTVTDGNSCFGQAAVNIQQPDAPLGFGPSGVQVTNETCFADADGSITVSAAGGTAPYEFMWSTGTITPGPTLGNLPQGEYFVTIVDHHDCAYLSSGIEVLGASEPLGLNGFEIGHASCFGEEDAFIDISPNGGFGNLSFDWNPPEDEEDLFNIPAGNYSLSIRDENLCQFDTTFEVLQPEELVLEAEVFPAINGSGGQIICEPSGGISPYQCQIPDFGLVGDTISNLDTGWYELIVIDANLCESNLWVYVPGELTPTQDLALVSNFLLFPNPSKGILTLEVQLTDQKAVDLLFFNVLGQPVFEKNIDASREIYQSFDLSHLESGIYWVSGKSEGVQLFASRLILIGEN